MRNVTRHFTSIACALGLLVLAPATSHAQNKADADTREITAYKLTEAGLGKYTQATRNLKGLPIDDCDEDSEVKSLSEAVTKIDAAPGVSQANVDFFRAHAADMEKMGEEPDDSTCDAAEDAEDGE